MKPIQYKDNAGRDIEIKIAADYRLNLQGERRTEGKKEVVIAASVNGRSISTIGGICKIDHPVAVARLGQLGFRAETFAMIEAAILEVESDIASENAKWDAHEQALDAASNATRSLEKKMACGEV